MRLHVRSMAFALGLLSGAVVLGTGIAHLIRPGYGGDFIRLMASVYPGYNASGSVGDLMVGVAYALVDGGIFGLVLAWLYNLFAGSPSATAGKAKRDAGVRYPPIEPSA